MGKRAKNTTTVLEYPDRGVGNDPEALRLAFHQGLKFNGQYESNDLPRPRRSLLVECFSSFNIHRINITA